MTDHDLLVSNYQMLQTILHICVPVLVLAVLTIIVSMTKLAMMKSLKEAVEQNTVTSQQYVELGTQFADLYVRENREAQRANRDAQNTVVVATRAMTRTVEDLTDGGLTFTPDRLARAKDRIARYEAAHPVSTKESADG